MNCELIRERDDTQETVTELWHCRPEAETIVVLCFDAKRRLNRSNAHLACDVRTLAQNAIHELRSKCVTRHGGMLTGRD
jgi:hypothetical protein